MRDLSYNTALIVGAAPASALPWPAASPHSA
jgi:hypothetical protein